jgi:hypothetical protein
LFLCLINFVSSLRRGNFVSVIQDTRFLSELLHGHFLVWIGVVYCVFLYLC